MNFIRTESNEYPITIDFFVVKVVCSKLNLKLQQFEGIVDNTEHLSILFNEALKRGAKQYDKRDFNLSIEETDDILSYSNNLFKFLKIFSESVLKMFIDKSEEKKS